MCAASPISECSFRAPNRKPVVAPPAESAANRPKSKHGVESVKQMHLAWFELNRIAARASVMEPQHARQPIRPDYGCMIHRGPSFFETTACIAAQLPSPERGFALRREMAWGVNSGRFCGSQSPWAFVHWWKRDWAASRLNRSPLRLRRWVPEAGNQLHMSESSAANESRCGGEAKGNCLLRFSR